MKHPDDVQENFNRMVQHIGTSSPQTFVTRQLFATHVLSIALLFRRSGPSAGVER